MTDKTKFNVVRGTDEKIRRDFPYQDGYVYFAVDTGRIYMDVKGKNKVSMGGSGAAVVYANTTFIQNPNDDNYTFYTDGLENPEEGVKIGDLVINNDGTFYKVEDINETTGAVSCMRIAVSGSGSGGGGGSTVTVARGRLTVTRLSEADLLNGDNCTFKILATSATEDGVAIDGDEDSMTVTIQYFVSGNAIPYFTESLKVTHGVEITYDATNNLRESTDTKITFTVTGSESNVFYNGGKVDRNITTHAISAEWVTSQFSSIKYFTDVVTPTVHFSTGARRILDIYFDGLLIFTKTYEAADSTSTASPQISKASAIYNKNTNKATETLLGDTYSHGRHTISAQLSLAKSDGSRGSATPILNKEIGIFLNDGQPLIWFGDMESTYYEFDNPQVPIKVYDPNQEGQEVKIYLFIDGTNALEDGAYYSAKNTDTDFTYWTLTNLKAGQTTAYQVRIGADETETWASVPEFTVLEDPRNMGVSTSALVTNIDSRGRSNSESAKKRSTLAVGSSNAVFKDFNWYNNGWVKDTNNVTCLRISNGASIKLPIGATTFAGSTSPSRTIELRMKIRNVQSYEKLITTYTRYKVSDKADALVSRSWKDDSVFAEFLAQRTSVGGFTNYDAYLTRRLPQLKALDSSVPSYDDLEYSGLTRDYNLSSAAIKYIIDSVQDDKASSTPAICFGAQDGYFTNGVNAVTIDFVEDKILNITIVYDNGDGSSTTGENRLMKIYLNGMLTSVARSTVTGDWTINNEYLTINSSNCDIDLYKFRTYNRALGLEEVLKNVAYDNIDTVAWDLAGLYSANHDVGEDYQFSYNKMLEYNKNHPKATIMPYIVFTTDETDTVSKGNLPWRKDTPIKVDMEFVNTGLDAAYAIGDLSFEASAAKQDIEDYYIHHCPSWTAQNVSLSVQGTSSEFYPRRNYKAKTKIKVAELDAEGKEQYDKYGEVIKSNAYAMQAHRGPFAAKYEAEGKGKKLKYFYFDNDTVGCNKFTLKVDYMESSGSYNMGLANLVNYAYSHHPLQDYNASKAFVSGTKGEGGLLTAYTTEGAIWYRNHKGNWKYCKTGDEVKDALYVSKYGSDSQGEITLSSPEDYNKGVWALAAEQGVTKVLGGTKKLAPTTETMQANFENSRDDDTLAWEDVKDYIDKWCFYTPGSLAVAKVDHLEDYRTSVQGFPTLAFWQTKADKKAGKEPLFIGRYNMLLDKGAAEAYGFSLDDSYLQAYIKGNPVISDIAECWEFENNSRGFCSYRDPWNRRELSFKAPDGLAENIKWTTHGAPIVADSFEYRYNALDDYIDYLVDLNNSASNSVTAAKVKDTLGVDIANNKESGREKLLELYSNWEKAVAWVWSTATDAQIDLKGDGVLVEVPSLNNYVEIKLAEAIFEVNKYYIESESHEMLPADSFVPGNTYYVYTGTDKEGKAQYRKIILAQDFSNVYTINTYYVKDNLGNYLLSEDKFSDTTTYYKAVSAETSIAADWLLPKPVTYGNTEYKYDTKEYRLAKFKNELTDHFNLEYLATYFVITEVLECYDSRGKNCMMASWGPQREGGDYIWYPIFYDMDTQLGINNTGIPSFEYNIDATEDGTFSTNDSVLWKNFYTLYLSIIKDKYEQLTGVPSNNFGTLPVPPFTSVEVIENIYNCEPKFTNSHSMEGLRPLLAFNLDEQYKYISITNPKVGYLGSGTTPELLKDTSDTYFYALQGNRSMSREQFLTNRLNYIDSWLAVGNYKRGGQNRIRSRVSANSSSNTSDKWIEGTAINGDSGLLTNQPYYKEDGVTKNHLFDGEYWITMTPVRDMYVTVGTDTANFSPLKYTGTPVRFETPDLENGVRKSGNYREQLYYVYGLDQMKSLGDLSRLYFQEFDLSGKATKMTDLKLGYDGLDEEKHEYKNSGVNTWTLTGSEGLPLVKEINLCNITFKNENVTFDFSQSEKLQNFRNTGSNITQVTFAKGVALDTLYLSDKTVSLSLVEARLLTNLIEEYKNPELNEATGNLEAVPGLYIAGLTDGTSTSSNLMTLSIDGGNLGYNSYKLLKKYYDVCKTGTSRRKINLTGVQWSPYVLIDDPDLVFDEKAQYFKDDDHFGLIAYTKEEYKASEWKQNIANGQMYEYNPDIKTIDITDVELLKNLIDDSKFIGATDATEVPNITGYIYINNAEPLKESTIQNTLVKNYPGLTFFFANVEKSYSAKFILPDLDDDGINYSGSYSYVPLRNGLSGKSVQKSEQINFENPYALYKPEKTNYDFKAWSSNFRVDDTDSFIGDANQSAELNAAAWSGHIEKLNEVENPPKDYIFYALFTKHKFDFEFYTLAGDAKPTETYQVTYGEKIANSIINALAYIHPNENSLSVYETYRFLGFTQNSQNTIVTSESQANLVDFSKLTAVKNYKFYAVFMKMNVHDNVTDLSKFKFTEITYDDTLYGGEDSSYNISGVMLEPKPGVKLSGKITLPTEYEGKPVIVLSGFANMKLTGVYWNNPQGDNPNCRQIGTNGFQDAGVESADGVARISMFEFPSGLRYIGENAFANDRMNNLDTINRLGKAPIIRIDSRAFALGFDLTTPINEFCIPGTVQRLGDRAFMFGQVTPRQTMINTLKIGSPSSRSALSTCGSVANPAISINTSYKGTPTYIDRVEVYTTAQYHTQFERYFNDGYIVEYTSYEFCN